MPSGRVPPSGFGMFTRRTASPGTLPNAQQSVRTAGAAREKGKGTNPTPGRALSRTATHLAKDGVDRQPNPGRPYRRIAFDCNLPPVSTAQVLRASTHRPACRNPRRDIGSGNWWAATQSRHQPGTPPRRDRPRLTGSAAPNPTPRNRRAHRSIQNSSLAGDCVTRGCLAVFERDADLMTAATPRPARSGWRRPPVGLPASLRTACFRRQDRRRRGLHSLRGRWVRAPAALPSRFRAVAGHLASRPGSRRRHGPPDSLPSSS